MVVVFFVGLLTYAYQETPPTNMVVVSLVGLLTYAYQATPPMKMVVVVLMGLLVYAYRATRPPPPTICGSPGGPPVTAPRIKLRDGRYLAYKEFGVPKDHAKRKIVFMHGGDNSRHDFPLMSNLSPDTIENQALYVVSFDRPGYGESDPHPKRNPMTTAKDVEELADQLELGSKFYVMGYSMGGEAVWYCLKYIPHRLAGATLLAPAINYWWSSFPSNLVSEAYHQLRPRYQWAFRVIHYLPYLTYWWTTQELFPSIIAIINDIFCPQDMELLPKVTTFRDVNEMAQVRQQGIFESLLRDLMIGFAKQEFDPMKLENPFPNGDGCVHVWMGDEDGIVSVKLQRFIAQQLPWICYHELQGAGHMFLYADGMADEIIKALLSDRCDVL